MSHHELIRSTRWCKSGLDWQQMKITLRLCNFSIKSQRVRLWRPFFFRWHRLILAHWYRGGPEKTGRGAKNPIKRHRGDSHPARCWAPPVVTTGVKNSFNVRWENRTDISDHCLLEKWRHYPGRRSFDSAVIKGTNHPYFVLDLTSFVSRPKSK